MPQYNSLPRTLQVVIRDLGFIRNFPSAAIIILAFISPISIYLVSIAIARNASVELLLSFPYRVYGEDTPGELALVRRGNEAGT